jgi:hypothetical protein
MPVIDDAIKGRQPGNVVAVAMEEIAACNKLTRGYGWNFRVEVAGHPELEAASSVRT